MKNKKIYIFSTVIALIIILLLPNVTKANYNYDENLQNNSYIKILYYTMPAFKVLNANEKDMPFGDSFKERVLYMLGLNVNNPLSIVKKEIAVNDDDSTNNNEDNNEKEALFDTSSNSDDFISPFKLNDNEVSSQDSESEDENMIDNKNKKLINNTVTLYNPKIKKNLNNNNPEVLIYHTHTSESYKPSDKFSRDNTQNVCAVGNEIKSELENNYGIKVIHDETINDSNYNKSYYKSSETLNNDLKKYKNLKLIIDIHRDGGGSINSTTIKMNNENAARIMLVIVTGNPRVQKNMAVAKKIMTISNNLFPGFCKGIYTGYKRGTNYFNQNKNDNCLLIEVGSNINTVEEAKNSAKYLARVMAEYINAK